MRIADSFIERLIGLAWRRHPPGTALLLPRTRSIHTFGMRSALDLYWLNDEGRVVRIDRTVPPLRVRTCLEASQVLEVIV
jgi:uncharacterized membrane protein (UPF0127 family)